MRGAPAEEEEMMRKQERKKRGRPPMEPGRAKRSSFNTRIRPGLKSDLEREAATSGRSLSEEIEFRLEVSFISDRLERILQRMEKI